MKLLGNTSTNESKLLKLPLVETFNCRTKKFVIKEINKMRFIDLNKISYFNSKSNYTELNLICGEKIIISKCLKNIETQLKDPRFFRIHASFIVNLDHLELIGGKSNTKFLEIVDSAIKLPISRSRYNKLLVYLQI